MRGEKAQDRETVHSCNACDKANKHKLEVQWPGVCKCCGKKFYLNNNIHRHKTLVCGKPHCRKFFLATFPCGPMTTIEEINPNLNVRARGGREEEGGSGQLQEEG